MTVRRLVLAIGAVLHNDYVAQCQSAVSQRRTWSIPVAVIGVLMAGGALLVGGRRAVSATTQGP